MLSNIIDWDGIKVGYKIYIFPKLKDLNNGPLFKFKTIPN